MYYILTHGYGYNPEKHISTTFADYNKAKETLYFLFDKYQESIESGRVPCGTSFTCILKAKGGTN